MSRRTSYTIGLAILAVAVMGLAAPAVRADTPDTWTATYGIHGDAGDPNSPLAFTVELYLARAASSLTSIGWQISAIEIRQWDEAGHVVRTWRAEQPAVGVPGGLWWTTHADVSAPQASEFVLPPLLQGTALADDPADADLAYEFEGRAYTAPLAGAPYSVTTAASYRFQVLGDAEPVGEGEDEPVESEPVEHEPNPHA